MKKITLLIGMTIGFILPTFAQISFSDQTSLLSDQTVSSGVAMGIADMNGDGLDDIVRLKNAESLRIEYQQMDGSIFSEMIIGTAGGSHWGMCIADVDENGFNDVMVGGAYNGLSLYKADSEGNSYSQTDLNEPSIFLQGVNFVDIDNNGTIDIFACHDDGLSAPFSNDGTGEFTYDLDLINTASTVPSDNSGNYGSTWTDYDNDGDIDLYLSKCRLGVTNPLDGRRLNLLFQNDGNNNFVDVAEEAGLLPYALSWATDFGDIDNDGDLDCVILNHDMTSQIYLNTGSGQFIDNTADSGISAELASIFGGIQCIFDDFDNDGYLDLLITTSSGHQLFHNNGDATFSAIDNPFPTGLAIQSAVTGDLNNDGYLDVYANFAFGFNGPNTNSPDKIFMNTSNGANYFKLMLKGEDCNINAIGARVEIHGDWGIQVREIRSGESYGIMNTLGLHFGIGDATEIDEVIIRWPNGVTESLCGVAMNQTMVVTENNLPSLLSSNFTIEEEIGFTVNFKDETEGLVEEWAWDFGDGATSDLQNPTHTFSDIGPYTISLTVSNDCETQTSSMQWELSVLPLDLLSFSAKKIERNKVSIDWITENEINFDYFELERSTDFRSIETLTKIEGKKEELRNQYQWLDTKAKNGINYYRLKQVDQDGTIEYSDWKSVKIESKGILTIFPNPAKERLMIASDFININSLIVFSADGKRIMNQEVDSANFEIDISQWQSGVYFMQIETEKESSFIRFSKI